MNQNNQVISRKNIKKLIEKSVFMPKELRNKLSKKLADPKISREKLEKIQSVLDKIISTEDSTIKEVLKKDPMFFKNIKRKISHEKLAKKLQNEEKLQNADLNEVEQELANLLIT